MAKKYKVVSLFSGCGGADLGLVGGFSYLGEKFEENPFEIVYASDINEKAVRTYNANFKHPAVVQDVTKLNLNIEADVVIGGFPCQPFSTVNPNKQPHKKESQLFWEMARIISEVNPKIFIAENVKGFFRLAGGKYFNLAVNEFESLGYNIYYKLINSADYGVPQKRERIIIIGVRKDLKGEISFSTETGGVTKIKKRVLKDVIDSLWPSDKKYFFSKRAVEGVKKAKPNMKRALAQNLDHPCLTITSHLAKVSLNSRDPVLLVDKEKELYRRFTPREAAAIQSFPESFKFVGSDGDAYRQIGNAVPPVVMWHIGKEVASVLAEKSLYKKANKTIKIPRKAELLSA